MSRRIKLGAVLILPWVGAALISHGAAAQSNVTGMWNLETRNLAQRATGGVRHVLLRIEDNGGRLEAEMTSPRSTFLPVQEFRYENGTMFVAFGAYEYMLEVDGEELSGTMVSPIDTLAVNGHRQEGTMFVGDEPEVFVSTRTAVLGHRVSLAPPDDEPDPVAWVRSRVNSVDDIALIVRGHAVSFTNADEYEDELMAYAGRRVAVTGMWIGERINIEAISLAPENDR